jgi:hypothetical protein
MSWFYCFVLLAGHPFPHLLVGVEMLNPLPEKFPVKVMQIKVLRKIKELNNF